MSWRRTWTQFCVLAGCVFAWAFTYACVGNLAKKYPFDCGEEAQADVYYMCMAQTRHDRSYCARVPDLNYRDLCYRGALYP